jgi:RNA polymerase sigma-70 factor (ECF subfamily)
VSSSNLLTEVVPLIPKLRAYAVMLLRSESEADDLVQDALLRAWRFREGYADGTNLKAWLFRILRNEFLRKVKRKTVVVEDPSGLYAARAMVQPEQEIHLRQKELLEGMQRLSPNTREAVVLVVGAGFSYAEAADLCGCSVGTMKSRVNRGRELLVAQIG